MMQIKVVNDSWVNGNADTNMHLVNFAPCFFKRCRVLCGGTLVSDEDNWNRLYHMLMQFSPTAARENMAVAAGQRGTVVGASSTFGYPVLAPLFSQNKMLPLSLMNITIEMELVDNIADVLLKTADLPGGVNGQSTSWHIEEAILMCDLVALDTSLSSTFSSHILSGKNLSIPFVSYYSVPHVITSPSFAVAMTRSLTRLKAIYFTFDNSATGKSAYDMDYPSAAGQVPELQMTLGSKKFPETALSSIPEYWYKLMEATGNHSSILSSSAISLTGYTSDSFVAALTLEKILSDDPQGSFAGISTKMGDLITVRCSNIAATVNECWTVIAYDGILQLSEDGVAVFD